MFLLIILLSYLLGCASTVALLLYLYTRYALYSPVVLEEPQQEQYEAFHPLPESERAKNSAVDTVNYIFQFLFQELKDSSRLRRYLMHKLNTEFNELKNSRSGRIFLQNIVIQNFSIGKECPTFSDIQLERQERDERHLIKEFVAKLDADYKDGFSVTLDVTLLFGHKCQLFIKVKRIQGHLRLEFRREPFCHWLLVFQDEPLIDFEVKSYFATVESPQLAQIITQQLRRAIKRKQTWPSYKIRYQPFFPMSKQPAPTEVLSASRNNLVPGTFDVLIKYCDRLSIPLGIFDKQKMSSVSVFLTINTNEQSCADYLHIDRTQWFTKTIEFVRHATKMSLKEVTYMDRTELLIEDIEPIPAEIEDHASFKAALEDKNVFLLKIQGQEVKTLKQTNRILKYKSTIVPNDGTTSITTTSTEEKIRIIVGMPLLHSVRVSRAMDPLNPVEAEKTVVTTATASPKNDGSSPLIPSTLRHRTVAPTVKFDKAVTSVAFTRKSSDGDDEQIQETNAAEAHVKVPDSTTNKKVKPSKNPASDITLIMMNTDILQEFQARPTPTQKAEPHVEFNERFEFQVGPNEKFLNICLWCKPPLDCDVPNAGKKLILLGYATAALSEIVLDAHMSFKRETQTTLNFRSAYSPKPNLNASLTDSESKKRLELSAHKGYDDNMSHGFVTLNIRHRPAIEANLKPQDKKEQFIANGPVLTDICTKLKEDERTQDQIKYINVVNERTELPSRKPTDHIFEDKTFTVATTCANCARKIWMKVGRQCRDCHKTIHRKCEEKFNAENICTHEPVQPKANLLVTPTEEELKSLVHIDIEHNSADTSLITTTTTEEIDSMPVKNNFEFVSMPVQQRMTTPTTAHRLSTKAAAAFSALDSTARRSFRAFGHRNANAPTSLTPHLSSTSDLSKSDESLHNPMPVPPTATATKPPLHLNLTAPASSKLANVASSAYSKLRELKVKRVAFSPAEANAVKKPRSPSDSKPNENISEVDLRAAITNYLADDPNGVTGLEHFLNDKAMDDTALYAKAREFGPELFPELTPDERKQRLNGEISRLQQEIDLQCQIRDEMTDECSSTADENEKRKIRSRMANIDEKVQALGALTILYCSGLKHCNAQMDTKRPSLDTKDNTISESPDEDGDDAFNDPQSDNNEDEQS